MASPVTDIRRRDLVGREVLDESGEKLGRIAATVRLGATSSLTSSCGRTRPGDASIATRSLI
jgi:hypothetical protein